jgi:hypothetical protein
MIPIPKCDAEWRSPKVQQEIQDVGMVALRMRMPQTSGQGINQHGRMPEVVVQQCFSLGVMWRQAILQWQQEFSRCL